MKNIVSFLIILVLIVGFNGCSKDFLNREPSGDITAQQLEQASKQNPDIPKAMVSGIYSLTFAFGTGGTSGHDDFGQKSIDIVTDLMTGDMALGGKTYGWFSTVYELKDQTTTDTRAIMNWKYYYTLIKAANEVIDGLGGNDAMPEDSTALAFYGQAKTIRAYAYYYLANLYQTAYDGYQNAKCVPLYTTQLTIEAQPSATVQEIYDQIDADLHSAITALGNYQRTTKTEINKYVAEGYLAYADVTTGNYSEAVSMCNDIINNGGFPMMDSTAVLQSGFNSITIPGWMWAIDLTNDNSPKLPTFWGMVDVFTYSYAGVGDYKGMDDDLWKSIPNTDVRKRQFSDFFGDGGHVPTNKFYDAARVYFGDRTWTNDEQYMRVSEFYLLKAEALARSGNDGAAQDALWQLVQERDPARESYIRSLTGQALLDEIYFQTRVELWGEGKTYLAMKRFKATEVRSTTQLDLGGVQIPYNDPRMHFQIPEDEVNNNPFISTADINAILHNAGSDIHLSKDLSK